MEKIDLMPCIREDFEDYFEIKCGDSEIFWMGYDGKPDRDMMMHIFETRLGDNRLSLSGDKRIYMIKVNGINVGFIQFSLAEDGLEFGYSVMEKYQGKGYGTAGMKLAVEKAKEFSAHVYAHIRDDNIASIKAMTRAGLKATDDVKMEHFPQTGDVLYRLYEN